ARITACRGEITGAKSSRPAGASDEPRSVGSGSPRHTDHRYADRMDRAVRTDQARLYRELGRGWKVGPTPVVVVVYANCVYSGGGRKSMRRRSIAEGSRWTPRCFRSATRSS